MKDQRAMIAHHEAGHAVTAYRLEFILGPVGIAESDGFSTSEGEWADGSRDEDAVLVYYAGHAAARRFDPSLPVDPDLCGATDDYERASLLLPTLMGEGETPEEAQAGMEQAAAAFVEGPISAVAEPTPASTRTSHRRGLHRRRGLAGGVEGVPTGNDRAEVGVR